MATEYDLGNVMGAQGAKGEQGISITNTQIDSNGDLIVTLSNGSTINAGSTIGPKGDKGDKGEIGKSAYEQAQEGGYSGTEAQFIVELNSISGKAEKSYVDVELLNKANITEVCRPNLFINGDFSIWQRGTSFDAPGYTADGWINATQKQSTVRVEKISTGLKATILGVGDGNLGQIIEFPERYAGKTLTLAIDCYTTGTYRAIYIGYAPEGQETVYKVAAIQQNQRKKAVLTVEIPLGITRLECGIGLIHPLSQSDAGTYTEMYAAKLEVGERFTGFYPENLATELARCQRYYQSNFTGRANGIAISTNFALLYFPLWVPTRTSPAVSIDANLSECLHDFKRATTITPTLITEYTRTPFGVVLKAEGTFIENNPLYLVRDVIHIDANL